MLVSTDAGLIYCYRPATGGEPFAVLPAEQKEPDATPQAAVPKIRVIKRPGLVGHWAFETGMSERAERRGLPNAARTVIDQAGKLNGIVNGKLEIHQAGGIEALILDGSSTVSLSNDLATAKLPTDQIAAEAWVRIDKPTSWGGIVGAIQDNGDYERGWLLGYRDTKFCFAVKSTGGGNTLTYLTAPADFQQEAWHHVVGTYDGQTMRLYVDGNQVATSKSESGKIDYPPQAFYEIGAYHDKDENFRLVGMIDEVRVYSRALSADEIRGNYTARQRLLPKPIELPFGPYAHFVDPQTAEVVWRTAEPSASEIAVGAGDRRRVVRDEELKTEHRLQINRLQRDRVHLYRIGTGENRWTPAFEIDTSFNFTRRAAPERKNSFTSAVASADVRKRAKQLLKEADINAGICLVLGAGDGALVYELVRQSDLIVIGLETDAEKVATARRALADAGVYGTRATMRCVESLAEIPFTGDFANLIVADGLVTVEEGTEAVRLARPDGGTAIFRVDLSTVEENPQDAIVPRLTGTALGSIDFDRSEMRVRFVRDPLDGAGEWSHLYGTADNSAFGGEQLGDARGVGDLQVQWLGRPGPRAQPDRNGRKPSPLSTKGRLYVQGLHRLIGLDAYNGTILWSLEIPPLQTIQHAARQQQLVCRRNARLCGDQGRLLEDQCADRCC